MQQILVRCLLCARHWPRSWDYSCKQSRQKCLPSWSLHSRREQGRQIIRNKQHAYITHQMISAVEKNKWGKTSGGSGGCRQIATLNLVVSWHSSKSNIWANTRRRSGRGLEGNLRRGNSVRAQENDLTACLCHSKSMLIITGLWYSPITTGLGLSSVLLMFDHTQNCEKILSTWDSWAHVQRFWCSRSPIGSESVHF